VCVVRLKAGASWPCVTPENYEVVAKSGAFWNKREVAATLEVDLSGGAGETYLVPSTFHPPPPPADNSSGRNSHSRQLSC